MNKEQPELAARGQPMETTLEGWRYLAKVYGVALDKSREENSKLRAQVNKLQQKLNRGAKEE